VSSAMFLNMHMSRLNFAAWAELHSQMPLHEADDRKVITHLTHLEDLVITKYGTGAQEALRVLRGVASSLLGSAASPVNITVKIDGAPAIVVGNDPADGKFFVGTKGAFAKTPKIAKSEADLKTLYGAKPGLLTTMQTAFRTLKNMNFPSILQGDVLFTPEIKQDQTIDGQVHVTFKPNTIVYGVPKSSELGKKFTSATFGVCFHTTYTGSTLQTLSATPGANISQLRPPTNVALVSSQYQDLSGTLTFTASESQSLKTLIADVARRTPLLTQNAFVKELKEVPLLQSEFMIFQNSLVRGGEPITLSPKVFVQRFVAYLQSRAAALAGTKKTPTGKATAMNKYESLTMLVTAREDALVDVLAWQQSVTGAKTYLINKLNQQGSLGTFYSSGTGLVAGPHEGFVASDKSGNFVKLVDRSVFSQMNLTQGRFRTPA